MAVPFSAETQLDTELDDNNARSPSRRHLPGYPLIDLSNHDGLLAFLSSEYISADLDRITPRLWWMSQQSSSNISPLHRQRVKQRRIVITEDPKLHLVWINDRIFIKPLPRYLTCYAFWRDFLPASNTNTTTTTNDVRKAALGYLRTYSYLIRSESDFRIATDPSLHLIPSPTTWPQFCRFTSTLLTIPNAAVSPRYHYGEIRLTRLNLYAPLLLGKSHFQRINYQYTDYFSRFFAPVLFVAGIASVVLSGLQVDVAVAVVQGVEPRRRELAALLGVAFWASVVLMAGFCAGAVVLVGLLLWKVAREWRVAFRDRKARLGAADLC
jgi:hypothetical protein